MKTFTVTEDGVTAGIGILVGVGSYLELGHDDSGNERLVSLRSRLHEQLVEEACRRDPVMRELADWEDGCVRKLAELARRYVPRADDWSVVDGVPSLSFPNAGWIAAHKLSGPLAHELSEWERAHPMPRPATSVIPVLRASVYARGSGRRLLGPERAGDDRAALVLVAVAPPEAGDVRLERAAGVESVSVGRRLGADGQAPVALLRLWPGATVAIERPAGTALALARWDRGELAWEPSAEQR